MDDFLPSIVSDGLVQLMEVGSAQEGRRWAEDGEVHATFIIPCGFSSDVDTCRGAEIEVVGNVDSRHWQHGGHVYRAVIREPYYRGPDVGGDCRCVGGQRSRGETGTRRIRIGGSRPNFDRRRFCGPEGA